MAKIHIDRHHIPHEKVLWYSMKPAKKIRQTQELIPRLERDVHDEIHLQCPIVPILGHHAMLRVAGAFEVVQGDTMGSLDNLLSAIYYAVDHPRVHTMERQLGQLMIACLETQKPFLVGNIITDDHLVRR